MFLATTALKEFWDAADELVLLGPWCVKFDDPEWLAGLKSLRHPSVWDDRDKLHAAMKSCDEVQEALLPKLADALNALHRTSFDLRYWRIVAGPWFLYHVQQTFERWTTVRSALDAHPGIRTFVLDPSDYQTPEDMNHFLELFLSDAYNLQLYSQAIAFLHPGTPVKRRRHVEEETPRRSLTGRLKDTARDVYHRASALKADIDLRHGQAGIVIEGLDPLGPLVKKLEAGLGSPFILLRDGVPSAGRTLGRTRDTLGSLPAQDEFERFLVSTLPVATPTLLIEGYEAARRRVVEGRSFPKTLLASNGVYYNERFKLFAAEAVANGSRLFGWQHGGQYGSASFSQPERHERRIADRYLVWGWSRLEREATLADVPVPSLSEAAKVRSTQSKRGILLIGSIGLKNPHELFPNPLGWQWEDYLEWRERFLDALGDLRKEVEVRLFPRDCGWNQKERLLRKFPNLLFDDRRLPFLEKASRAALVVADHPGTVFTETMGVGLPGVHFWREDRWEQRDTIKPLLSGLAEAGVIHDSPESAAAKIHAVWKDPESWWRSPAVKTAREAFCRLAAPTDPDWPAAWKKVVC
ncbi:MAG: hypothetical protein HY925_03685 [Elusimicrobia bacterium]|nr:hypothetical protein [Elusimicrobiota bacterium]